MLAQLGFTNVKFFDDQPNMVASADQDEIRGHVLSNGIDANGRVIAFVYAGDSADPDGVVQFVDEARADQSVNAALLREGLVYPAFYATLPVQLREHLATVSRQTRGAVPQVGIWSRATADPDGAALVNDLAALELLVVWPKLFRRLVSYLGAGFTSFDGLDAWLRADPVNRDDELFLLDKLERGNLHDVIHTRGNVVQLTAWPEDFIISPDPPRPGEVTEPRVGVGDLLVVAAVPDPIGPDRGHELVTLINTTSAPVDLTGWGLADAGGGRAALTGTIDAGGVVQITLDGGLQLGNRGDSVVLLGPGGEAVDQVSYRKEQVRTGRTICFGR
jgi:hypothetical protein